MNIQTYEEFQIEDLGVQEEWVYDIEVENNHNFFGNNILVHNSVYFSIEPFMERYIEENPGHDINYYVEVANNFEKKTISPMIQNAIAEFAEEMNAFNVDAIGCDREVIADRAVFCKKKMYYMRVRDNEGKRYPADDPYYKVMGMDIAKSGTPIWSKKKLKQAIPKILDTTEAELRQWIKDNKADFMNANVNEIANVISSSNIDYRLDEGKVPYQARCAIVHNNYVKGNDLEDKINMIPAGEKFKHLFLQTPNHIKSDRTGFTSDMFANILEEAGIIDYDTQYEKQFLNLLDKMTTTLGYDVYRETDELDEW